jgi:LacI family transcriptional regulator
VGFDNRVAAIQLVNYLLDIGHREFAMISGVTANNERARELAASHGLSVREELFEQAFSFAQALGRKCHWFCALLPGRATTRC